MNITHNSVLYNNEANTFTLKPNVTDISASFLNLSVSKDRGKSKK